MSKSTLLCTLLLAMALMVPPANAQDDRWQLRIGGVWVDPDVNFSDVDSDGDRVQAGADSEIGFGLALERRYSPRLGLELGVLHAAPDVTLDVALGIGPRFSVSDSVGFTAVTAGLNIHLTPDKAVDLYAGPLLAYALFDDVGFQVQVAGQTLAEDFSTDDDFAFGAQIGADIPFGDSPWSLNLAARYLDVGLEVTGDGGEKVDLGFDPLILSAGFGYRF